MLNIGRCPRCHKFLVAEEVYSHSCEIEFKGVKEILVDHCYSTGKDGNLDTVFIAKGLDGFLYRLVVCKHNPPHATKPNLDSRRPPDKLPVYPIGG
jgi:hypothetical protein